VLLSETDILLFMRSQGVRVSGTFRWYFYSAIPEHSFFYAHTVSKKVGQPAPAIGELTLDLGLGPQVIHCAIVEENGKLRLRFQDPESRREIILSAAALATCTQYKFAIHENSLS
jgi:hypothetical protein